MSRVVRKTKKTTVCFVEVDKFKFKKLKNFNLNFVVWAAYVDNKL